MHQRRSGRLLLHGREDRRVEPIGASMQVGAKTLADGEAKPKAVSIGVGRNIDRVSGRAVNLGRRASMKARSPASLAIRF